MLLTAGGGYSPLGREDWKIRGILMFWRIGLVPFKYRGALFVLIRNLGVIHCLFPAAENDSELIF